MSSKLAICLLLNVNNEQLLVSDINNNTVREKIREIPKGGQIDINQIPNGAFLTSVTEFQALFWPCSCTITIEQFDCNSIRVYGSCKDLLWGRGNAVLKLSYEFYNPTAPFFQVNTNGSFEFIIQPPVSGVVYATIYPNCITASNKTVSVNFQKGNTTCDARDRDSNWQWFQNGNEGLFIVVRYYTGNFSNYEQADAYSHRWSPVKNKWERAKTSKLSAQIIADRRYKHNCQIWDHEEEKKSCTNCDKIFTSINTGIYPVSNPNLIVAHCTGDVTGVFKKIHGSTTVDVNYDLEFECCL